MLHQRISYLDLSTWNKRPIFFLLIFFALIYQRGAVTGNIICTFNPCTFNPEMCANGGTCTYNSECFPVCECLPDFKGERCEISERNNSCVNKCLNDTCSGKGQCTQDLVTCKLRCTCHDGFDGDTCNFNGTLNSTTNPCYPVICVHGNCSKTAEHQKMCICEDEWFGDTCNILCKRNCTRGNCAIINGKEICSCPENYDPDTNCTEKVKIIKPSPIKNETSSSSILLVLLFPILLLLVFALLVYLMWRKRMIFIMRIVYYLQKYEDTDDKLYDAFISFRSSKSDEYWVFNTLFPMLENTMEFKICVHYRDFAAGETISNNIIDAIEKSRRTILVISPDYVNGEWTRMEYQVAQQEMLSLRHKIIPIIFRDISHMETVDKNLKLILKSITYIEWPTGENQKQIDKFWEKLKLTMPKKHEVKSKINGGDIINEWSATTKF